LRPGGLLLFEFGFGQEIDAEQLLRIAASLKNTYYGRYLEAVAQEARHQY